MKKSVAKKWVKALRSGEYKQGKGRLVDRNDNFCCLGVLCNIAPDSLGEWVSNNKYVNWEFKDNEGETDLLLPPSKIIEWAGMNSFDGYVLYPTEISVAEMNDDGASFDEIADFIEKNVNYL